ncbi:MAG: type II CAAX endopeptidase family protein [Candidatus Acidiferrales bacterium]
MEISVAAPSPEASDRSAPAAGPLYTILVVAAVAAWAFCFKILADRLSAATHAHRLRFYALTILLEWLMFALVVAGVRSSGASILLVVGERWSSARQVLRDIGIALGFWIVAIILLRIFAQLLRATSPGRALMSMVPHGPAEIAVWIGVSISAGICEETIFRGYLQRQFIAFRKNVPAGIALAAVAFGSAHAYQGLRMVILISLFGAMFGILAYWRGSVRPGMIAHAWQDSLSGVVAGLIKH